MFTDSAMDMEFRYQEMKVNQSKVRDSAQIYRLLNLAAERINITAIVECLSLVAYAKSQVNPYLSESIKSHEQRGRTKRKHGGTDLEKNKLKKHRYRERGRGKAKGECSCNYTRSRCYLKAPLQKKNIYILIKSINKPEEKLYYIKKDLFNFGN